MFAIRKIGLILILLLGGAVLRAQVPPRVEARITPDSVMIGDQFKLRVEITKDVMQVVEFPEFKNRTLTDSIEILAEGPVDTVALEGRNVKLAKEYLLTSFDAGWYRMGNFPVLYADKNLVDTLRSSDSLQIKVYTFPIDTVKQTIYDIKAPAAVPLLFGEFSGYVIFALVLALIVAGLVYYFISRRKREMQAVRKAPAEPPHVTAIRQLEKVHSQKLWQSGKQKQYYTKITDILRDYLEERFRINAMEMTSQEILDQMKQTSVSDKSREHLSDILLTADFVKFAKYQPDAEQNESVYTEAYYFVEETKESEREEPAVPEPVRTGKEGAE